ncbi:hypothetical protein JCM9957A_59300 [Kineosporia succinea]
MVEGGAQVLRGDLVAPLDLERKHLLAHVFQVGAGPGEVRLLRTEDVINGSRHEGAPYSPFTVESNE